MKSYDEARIMGKRAFYERATDSIRLCPENYCLAVKANGKWKAYDDGAIRDKWAIIQTTIDEWQNGSTGDALAGEIGKLFV